MAAPEQIPVGGAGAGVATAPAGINEEDKELTIEEWNAKVTHDITTKPIFLIATHGFYDNARLTSPPSQVPKGCMIVELTSLTDLINSKCGKVGSPLRTLLTLPTLTAEVITSPPGRDFQYSDIKLLHMSAKYTDTDKYYERALLLSNKDIAENQKDDFYIDKFYHDPTDGTVKIETLRPLMEQMAQLTSQKKYIYSNDLINHIMITDSHAKAAGGCICIIAACADLMKGVPLNMNTYYKFQKHFEDHRFKYHHVPERFIFTPMNSSTRRKKKGIKSGKKKGNGLIIHEPSSTAKDIPPEESFLPNTKTSNELLYGTVLPGHPLFTGTTYHGLYTGLVDDPESNHSSNSKPVYPSSNTVPKIFKSIKNIPTNIEHGKLLVNNKIYFIGPKRRTDLTHEEIVQELTKFRLMKRSKKRETQRKAPKKVLLYYKGKWIPVKI